MADYSKALIYTIRTDDGLYVGSTCNFKDREKCHRASLHNEFHRDYNLKLYQNIRENNRVWKMEKYKDFPCKNRTELRYEEDRIMIELNANLNERRAYVTAEECKEYQKKYCREHYEKNKVYALGQQKLYYEKNKDEISAKQKLYCKTNRDKIITRKKLYYEKNKDEISAKQNEIITCECGSNSKRTNISRHRKSKKHLKLMESVNKK